MVLMIPLNALVYRNIRTYQMEQMKNKDRRNKMMDEILNGMKIIKLYAWESSFLRKVNDIRDQEIYALKVRNYYYSTLEFQAFLYSLLAGFICKSMRCQIGTNLWEKWENLTISILERLLILIFQQSKKYKFWTWILL